MYLPANKRKDIAKPERFKAWIYGEPMSGKSVFADGFENVLHLNTDGNTAFLTAPTIRIASELGAKGNVIKSGELVFEEAVDLILAGNHTFSVIHVDLVEDIYDMYRDSVFKERKIEHEADEDGGKGYDLTRRPFLSALRKLTNSKYNIILSSHEKVGQYKTRFGVSKNNYKPPFSEQVNNKIAGMVDYVIRLRKEDVEDKNGLLKTQYLMTINSDNPDEFGGSRNTTLKCTTIETSASKFLEVIGLDGEVKAETKKTTGKIVSKLGPAIVAEDDDSFVPQGVIVEETKEATPKREIKKKIKRDKEEVKEELEVTEDPFYNEEGPVVDSVPNEVSAEPQRRVLKKIVRKIGE